MKVIAFYSFKGGVGRTMSLLATAYSLARRGRKVVVADWDLHAPGLSLMECLRPAGAGLPRLGMLEYLTALHPDRWGQSPPEIEDMLLAPRLIDEARGQTTEDGQPLMLGDLFFIPAGDLGEGVDRFIEAVKQANLQNLQSFLQQIDPDPRMVFKVFRQQVENANIPWHTESSSGPPDYLLVDCRTGITEIGELLLADATDYTVIVYGQDIQNLEGLRIVLNASQREPGSLAANTMLIWSGGVAGQEQQKVEQRRYKNRMIEQVCRCDSLGLREAFPKEFLVPFNPDLVYADLPLVHRVPDGEFARLFQEITDYLEERCLWPERIIEAAVAPIDPTKPMSEEQRRLKIASTSEAAKSQSLRQAYLDLELSRGLTPLLFNPPPWNLAAVPTPEIVSQWPEGFSSEQDQTLLLQLLAYSISLLAREKKSILDNMGKLTPFQLKELLKILTEERVKWLALPPDHFQALIQRTLTSACEWLAMLVMEHRADRESPLPANWSNLSVEVLDQLDGTLLKLVNGEPIHAAAEFSHPLFPLLVAEAIRTTGESSKTFLPKWLAKRSLDSLALRECLTLQAASAAQQSQLSDAVQGRCWERAGATLDDCGRAAEESAKAGWFDRAIAAYERSLQLRPDHADTLHNLGITLANRGRAAEESAKANWFDRAIAAYERSLQLRPDHADTLLNLGTALDDRGRVAEESAKAGYFDRAIAAYERSLQLRPDHAATLHNLGFTLNARGRAAEEPAKAGWFDRAIAAYERSRQLRPDHADTLNGLGTALDDRGRAAEESAKAGWFDRAIAAYERSLQLRPDDAGTLGNLTSGLLLRWRTLSTVEAQKHVLDRAAETIAKAMTLDAREARYNFACVLALQGNSEQALAEIRLVLAENPAMRNQVAQDVDFASLADLPEFQKLIADTVRQTD